MSNDNRVARYAERWKAIRDFSVSPDFISRLAAKNGWTLDHATKVDAEYKKFLLISTVTAATVVPSSDIDAAWHEHILNTRSYQKMCTVLGFVLHHTPGPIDGRDRHNHEDGYNLTLDLYRKIFQHEAPSSIWPKSKTTRSIFGRIGAKMGVVGNRHTADDSGAWIMAIVPESDGKSASHKSNDYAADNYQSHATFNKDVSGHSTSDHSSSTHNDSSSSSNSSYGGSSCGGSSCGGGGD